MKIVVIDTSIIINYVRGKDKFLVKLLQLQEKKQIELVIPSLVIFEFYSGLSLDKKEVFEKAETLFGKFKIIEVNKEVAKLAAKINRRKRLYKKIGAGDLLIGVTALYLSGYLATLNKKDFLLIPRIKFYKN